MPAPDQAQRDKATDISRSVIVQAPAGSGKTTLLVERYLKLLSVVDRPEEILAITFTRKAASEMQTRILDALLAASQDGQGKQDTAARALERSESLGWQLLEQPNRLKIQTIDSFAMSLNRGLPVASGFDPTLALTETAGELYRSAARRLLLRLYEEGPLTDEIADFLRQCDNDSTKAERLLATMLGKRDQWLEIAASVVATHQTEPAEVGEVLKRGVDSLNNEVLTRFRQSAGNTIMAELETLAEHAAAELGEDIDTPHRRHRFIGAMLTTTVGNFRKQVTKRNGFTTKFPELKARLMDVIEALSLKNLGRQAANLRYLPDPAFREDTARRLVNVCVNLALANSELQSIFKQSQLNDFTTLILNAQAALGDALAPTELALALDYRIHHLLVDEFQDTSVSQFRLFEMLLRGWQAGDGNSFFAVGDPMQSIYRFRDADVGLFFRAWEHGIADIAPEPVVLTSNFRADARLVRWVNHAFGRIMGTQQDPILGQIGYRPATPTLPADSAEPATTLYLRQTHESQVQVIAESIEALLQTTEDTIALLVRSRSQLKPLIQTLRSRGISWHANDIDPLLNKPVVRDLLSLVSALADPNDRLSWLSLLRSPLVGLRLSDLEALTDIGDLMEVLSNFADRPLSSSGRARLQRLADAWVSAASKLDEHPPRSVVETLWLRLGGADAYPDPGTLVQATRLLELIDSLGSLGLSSDALSQAAIHLFATDLTDSRLEILTIHKSKGLEFDHVLVPFLERKPQADEAELLLWRPLPHGILMGVKDDDGPFDWLARENRFRERHERQRLLYVACTRARKSLRLFATETDKPPESALLAQLWPMIGGGDIGEMTIERTASGEAPAQTDLFDTPEPVRPQLQRLRDSYQWQPPVRTPLRYVPERNVSGSIDVLDKRLEVVLGIVVHAALERLADKLLPADRLAYLESQRPVWQSIAASHDLPEHEIEAVVAGAARQIEQVLDDADGRWLLAAHQDGRAEFAITGVLDGQIENLIIDRTFVSDDVRWIIDYKTSVPPRDAQADAFVRAEIGRHRGQLARYAKAAEGLFEQQPRLAIYFTAIPHLEILR